MYFINIAMSVRKLISTYNGISIYVQSIFIDISHAYTLKNLDIRSHVACQYCRGPRNFCSIYMQNHIVKYSS